MRAGVLAALDGRLIDQFTGLQQPWVAHPDNVRSFFRTGGTLNTNIAVARATEDAHIRLSLTRSKVEGMSPGNSHERVGMALKGGASITDRISTEASLNYTDLNVENRPGTGYDEDNPMQSFIWFGRQVDMETLRNYTCTGSEPTPCIEGSQYNWNYNYHNNPFWEALVNTNGDERDRMFGHLAVSYQITDWITSSVRFGRDWYRHHKKWVVAPNSLDDAGEGSFRDETQYRAETNADLLISATRQLTPNLTLDVTTETCVPPWRIKTCSSNYPSVGGSASRPDKMTSVQRTNGRIGVQSPIRPPSFVKIGTES